MKKNWMSVFFFLSLMMVPAAYAKVTIQPDFDGTLLITSPDGKVSMIDKGEALPEIASGSKIEVFGGQMTVSTEEGDKVTCICGGSEAGLGGGATAAISCQEEGGIVKAVKGTIVMTNEKGEQTQIAEGSEKTVKNTTDEVPETQAGDPVGAPTEDDSPAVDPRSLQSSPAQ